MWTAVQRNAYNERSRRDGDRTKYSYNCVIVSERPSGAKTRAGELQLPSNAAHDRGRP